MEKHWHKFYECDCNSEGIMLSNEYDIDGPHPLMDMAFFYNGHLKNRLSLVNRIRWCWRILRKGLPFADMVILNKQVAKELAEDLLEWAIKEQK